MSRVGKMPIKIPDKVKVRLENGTVHVEGPKGKLSFRIRPEVAVEVKEKEIVVTRKGDDGNHSAMHGMTRAVINNMVKGVSEGFTKILDIVGVGYKAEAKGKELLLSLGFSHPVNFPLPEGIEAKVDRQTRITLSGADRKVVGETAAKIRDIRPPEPYKGKGVRYAGEVVKQKVGKAAATAGA